MDEAKNAINDVDTAGIGELILDSEIKLPFPVREMCHKLHSIAVKMLDLSLFRMSFLNHAEKPARVSFEQASK